MESRYKEALSPFFLVKDINLHTLTYQKLCFKSHDAAFFCNLILEPLRLLQRCSPAEAQSGNIISQKAGGAADRQGRGGQSHGPVVLTSSVTMMSGYRSSDRKLKMHQILKASSLLMVSLLWSRFLRLHSVQHILLNSCWSKLLVTCSRVGVQKRFSGNQTSEGEK